MKVSQRLLSRGVSSVLGVRYSVRGAAPRPHKAGVPMYRFEVMHSYPHDPTAFTEGLFYLTASCTKAPDSSSILRSGRCGWNWGGGQKHEVPKPYFGEGIVNWKRRLVSLTWKSHIGFVYDLATFKEQREFHYEGEGWALTQDGKQIIMSDGTPELRFLNPDTLLETRRITVTLEGKPVRNVNELEWVKGEIYANVWQTDWILRIDPHTGEVVGLVNLRGSSKRLIESRDRPMCSTGLLTMRRTIACS